MHEPRAVCPRCRRPARVCYCAELPSLRTPKTRVLILQHPRERDMPIGTARMASLCLPDAELWVGIDWTQSEALAQAIADPARPAALLYPGEGARDVTRDPPREPVTLVVIDGTWATSKKMLRVNPALAALPRWAFTPPTPSEYRIRREPNDACVSTIEALMHVLGAIEGDAERFHALLRPFRYMVDIQIAHARETKPRARHIKKKEAQPPAARVPRVLWERAKDVVVVAGEANAWPYEERIARNARDEIVHWVACRPQTGETFEAILAPQGDLAPGTSRHIQLAEHAIRNGISLAETHARWNAFVKPTDVIASWGSFGTRLFEEWGGALPASRVDLRRVAHVFANARVGTLAGFAADLPEFPAFARGRGGTRAAQLAAVALHFARVGRAHAESTAGGE